MLFPHNTPTQKPKTLNTVPSSMSMLMSNSLGMPVSLCGGSSFFGIFSKMFSADLSLFSSSSASALCVLLKGLRRKRRAFLFVVERFDLWGGKGRRFEFPFWFWWEATTTHDAHVVSIIVVAFVVPLSLSLLLSVCFLRVTCTLSCCTPPPCLASVFSFLSRCVQHSRSFLLCGGKMRQIDQRKIRMLSVALN